MTKTQLHRCTEAHCSANHDLPTSQRHQQHTSTSPQMCLQSVTRSVPAPCVLVDHLTTSSSHLITPSQHHPAFWEAHPCCQVVRTLFRMQAHWLKVVLGKYAVCQLG